jgi:hypothetical protein
LLVVNAANIEKDWNWCAHHARERGLEPGRELYNASDEIAQLAVQGPMALKIMQKITDEPVEHMKFYTFKKLNIAGIQNAIFQLPDIQVRVVVKYTLPMKMGLRYGMQFSRQAGNSGLSLSDWVRVIPCDWRWDIAFMVMILMKQPRQ